ncbi:methionyl-tRNA formyltransferase [Zafaria sp. Z1313]|uniref:methionyl-tRNA formyltransferase n=1 Tax=Zafaria sp. Z1313 TaxID=3423202 RepID=UPI003D30261C
MRILFAGTPAVAVPSLRRLVEDGHDVAAVLTRPDAPTGRKRTLTPSPVAACATELGLPLIHARRIDATVRDAVRAVRPELAAIVAYGGLVPREALGIPEHGWINLHFSLLPRWRGAAPVQHAVIHGDEITGAATFQLEEGLDTGPVFGTVTQPVDPGTTSGELLEALSFSGAELLAQTVAGIAAGRLEAVPQAGEPSLAPKLGIEDGRVDWAQPALAIRRRINGTTPEPGAWTELDGQRLKLGPLRASGPVPPEAGTPRPGGVVVLPGKRPRVFVGTGSHPLELETVQPAGRKMMPAADWARGLPAPDATPHADPAERTYLG